MIFKYYFFDLDDTLYDYTTINNHIIRVLSDKYNLNYDYCKNIINSTGNLNFKHNKLYYLNYDLPPTLLNNIYNEYNKYIFDNITLYDGVLDLIKYIKNIGKKIGIITNNLLELQLKKLEKLDILNYIDCIITSEEAQYEKPHKNIYELALGKTNMKRNEVCMIGDNLTHDIMGSMNCNIFSYYFNNKRNNEYIINNNYIEFSDYNILLKLIIDGFEYSNKFIKLAIKYGQDIGMTQYNGGNISIKFDDIILVKSSGYELGNMDYTGISYLNNKKLVNIMNDDMSIPIIYGKKPSIESHFHSILNKYVVHIHPATINGILCDIDAINIINNLNIEYEILILDYIKPGIDIKNSIIKNFNKQPIIFLLNHGIIVHSDDISEIDNIYYHIFSKFNLKSIITGIKINNLFKFPICIYQTYNSIIIDGISGNLLDICPDYTLYLKKPLVFEHMNDFLNSFYKITIPFICKINENIYIIATTIKKCKNLEDLYCGYLMTMCNINKPHLLNNDHINNIINRDDEKYRLHMQK
jgi:putative hydrolase of the HAD superfamily